MTKSISLLTLPTLDEYPDNPAVFRSALKLIVEGKQLASCHLGFRFDSYMGWCSHFCSYCLGGETPIAMSDGTIKRIKDLVVGDLVIGATHEKTGWWEVGSVAVGPGRPLR